MPTNMEFSGKGLVERNARLSKGNRQGRRAAQSLKGKRHSLYIKSILVPIDFSAESERAIPHGIAFARRFGAKVTLLHVVEPIATPDFAESFPLALQSEERMKEANERLGRVVKNLGAEPKLLERTAVRYGRAFHEIIGAARSLNTDLIIISTHGYTGFKHALLGSVTERVVQHAPCPVLVVRPCEHEILAEQRNTKRGSYESKTSKRSRRNRI